MDLEFNDAQREWHDAAADFARRHLAGDVIAADRDETFDRAAWKAAAGFGVLAMPVPKELGGLGLPITEVIAVMEGLGYGAKDQGLLFSLNAHLWTNTMPLVQWGTPEQRARWLPGLIDGSQVGANGASEPDSGSDVFAMRTRARRDGDVYVLDGTKMFVTNAPVADVIVAYATIDPKLGAMGVTGFIVDAHAKGVTISKKIEKLGLRTSPMAEVVFEGVRVPVADRLGREGRGVAVFESSMEWERGCILASCLGVMRRQLERCVAHARQRRQFGQAIGKFQSVANRMVDMRLRIDTCRPLVYRIGRMKEAGRDCTVEAALAKLHVSDCFVKNGLDAIQVFGGYGYMTEYELERELRDAVGSTLYSGTSEIQRNLIARGLGL
ncbi:MAG: acyl-CoA dehydrogenase [Planctomycetes bacterium]|nr:acyl-CoA dehydrogenase [Planctomycetota bacterium]